MIQGSATAVGLSSTGESFKSTKFWGETTEAHQSLASLEFNKSIIYLVLGTQFLWHAGVPYSCVAYLDGQPVLPSNILEGCPGLRR